MADKKISQLPNSSALTGEELVPIVQAGVTAQTTVSNFGAAVGYLPAGTGAVATTMQAKLRESVSVKDFGAVGDGVTDDSAAFTAADATGFAYRIPNGKYKRGSTVTQYFMGTAKTVLASDTEQSIYCENVQVQNPTGKTGYGVRFALYNHSGNVSSGLNDIGDALINRWSSVQSGSGWGRWDVVSGPLPIGSGLTGAPTVAQSFGLVTSEVNPQNRTANPSSWVAENRLNNNWVGGQQIIAETQDFSGLLGSTRIGYNITFGYSINKSPFTANFGTSEHAKFMNGVLVNPNAIAPTGYAYFATGHLPYSTAVAIASGGTGYAVGDVITFNTGLLQTLNENTQLKVLTVAAGVITSVEILVAGSYTQSFSGTVGVTGGTGTGATFTYTLSTSAVAPRAMLGMSGQWTYGIDFCTSPTQRYASFVNAVIRIPSNTTINSRNAGDTADLSLIFLNTSDQVTVANQRIITRAAWTPTFTADAGTLTTVTVTSARYSQINALVQFALTFQIVTKGTATGAIKFSLPVNASGQSFVAQGINASAGAMLSGLANGGGSTPVRLTRYDGADPMVDGNFYTVSGTYEAAAA
jgi:hypothetical protein